MAELRLSNLEKSYTAKQKVIQNVNLHIPDGQFTVFVGPSGCGKSTLLRMIAGLESISAGDIFIDGKCVNALSPVERGIAMVFQNYALYPHMSVEKNMGFSLKMAGMSKKEVRESVGRAAEILQITHLLDRKPKALSGGQRQRVAIGRSIVRQPSIFLFDEPLSNLDASLRVQMRIELAKLHQELGTTMVYVTHDQVEAMTLGEQIIVFNKGCIEQAGAPLELYHHPKNQFVGGFLGSPHMNMLPVKLLAKNADSIVFSMANSQIHIPKQTAEPLTGEITVGVRPEHLSLVNDKGQDGIAAKVELFEHLGDISILHARIDDIDKVIALKVELKDANLPIGSAVKLRIDPKAVMIFNEAGKTVKFT